MLHVTKADMPQSPVPVLTSQDASMDLSVQCPVRIISVLRNIYVAKCRASNQAGYLGPGTEITPNTKAGALRSARSALYTTGPAAARVSAPTPLCRS